ncbi:MAG: NAD(P)-dependent oxidoreductase [Magnetospirillum sp. WYHS-4]
MARILLLGHTGKMGTALDRELAAGHEVMGRASGDFDAADFAAVTRLIAETKPEAVVNTIAQVRLDDCERAPSEAFRINTLFPQHLARLGASRGFRLIHFSTDSVFSGAKGDFLTEDDLPDPVSTYGFTKYMSEVVVREALEAHYIFRLPVLFGGGGRRTQFLERMLDRVRAGERRLKVVTDMIGTPAYAKDVAATVSRVLDERRPYGLYHLANTGQASLYELTVEALRMLGLEADVEKATLADFPAPARRSTTTPLRMTKLPPLRPWREALAEYCATEEAPGALSRRS